MLSVHTCKKKIQKSIRIFYKTKNSSEFRNRKTQKYSSSEISDNWAPKIEKNTCKLGKKRGLIMFMAPKNKSRTVLTPNDPKKGCLVFLFQKIWNRNGLQLSYSISLLQQNAQRAQIRLNKKYRYTHTKISGIYEISLIKSTNVQIMQDVLKYGKHLNISWAEFQAS